MSISFHLGHSSHSLIKAFVNTTHAVRTAWIERTTQSAMTRQQHSQDLGTSENMSNNHFDLPERSSRAPSHTEDMDFESSGSTVRNEQGSGDDPSSFGEHSRNLIEVIRKLEALGIDSTLSSLPKFVVVGDQSHGKSSIIEAVCSISLPRSSGTCTRCPFRITTTAARPGEAWSCKIALSRRWVLSGRGGAWKNTDAPSVDFTTVTDMSELEQVLRLAQVAILNPRLDPSTLLALGAAPAGLSSLSFSPNAIDLHICGPDLPELSIVDLPGSINVAPDESEQHLVSLIEKLIKSYVKDEKAQILLVASMDQDLETSTAFRFVRSSKAEPRSMGVLTKPDLAGRARFEYLRHILQGKSFPLDKGWFVTKNCTQEELDDQMSHSEARKQEEDFFARVPWCSNFSDYADRFGTKNLQSALSHRLVEHIEAELPEIIARVNTRLHEVFEELNGIPGPPTNASATVIEEIRKLEKSIEENIKGNDEGAAFRSGFKKLLRGFRDQLRAARPHINLATPGYVKPVLSIDSDEDMTMEETPSKKRKAANGRATPASTPSGSEGRQRASGRAQDKNEDAATSNRITFSLNEIYSAFDKARDSEMPDEMHPKVKQHFIRQSIAPWPALTISLLDEAQGYVGGMVAECIVESLRSRNTTALFTTVQDVVEQLCIAIWTAEINIIEHSIACEQHRPITFASSLTKNMEDIRARLRYDRTAERLDEYFDTIEVERNIKVPVGAKRKEKINDAEFISKTLGPDKYAAVIDAMASPLAYYDLAAAHVVDSVAKHLEYGVLHALETKLGVRLTQELRVSDEEYCAKLLAEDAEREAQRMKLQVEKAKLQRAVEQLEALPGQNGMGS